MLISIFSFSPTMFSQVNPLPQILVIWRKKSFENLFERREKKKPSIFQSYLFCRLQIFSVCASQKCCHL